jgi:hypothetical protein
VREGEPPWKNQRQEGLSAEEVSTSQNDALLYSVGGGGCVPRPVGDEGLERNGAKGNGLSTSEYTPLAGGAKSGAVEPENAPERVPRDADLAAVVNAWPGLPAEVKAGILAMVKAARRDGAEG